jgi:hypothetical protein
MLLNGTHLPLFRMQMISSSPFCNADVDAVPLKTRKLKIGRGNAMYSKYKVNMLVPACFHIPNKKLQPMLPKREMLGKTCEIS